MTMDLEVEHLEVRYGDLVGVSDISLKVEAGKIVALLGSNGAGKTTTLNAIAGLVKPTGGRVTWHDEEIAGLPAYKIISKGLALAPEGWRLFVSQTVEQNLRFAAKLADRHYVIEHGRTVDMVPNDELDAKREKIHRYLGV